MLHRFGADPRARRTCPWGRGGQHRGMLRSRGCCFTTRNLTSRRRRRIWLLLERARAQQWRVARAAEHRLVLV